MSERLFFGPAGSDYTGKEGCIVNVGAKVAGLPRAILATGSSAQGQGVITRVGLGTVNQELTVQTFGPALVLLGIGWTAGTDDPAFISDANGAAIPATAGSRPIGRLVLGERTNLAAGNRVECNVYPHTKET